MDNGSEIHYDEAEMETTTDYFYYDDYENSSASYVYEHDDYFLQIYSFETTMLGVIRPTLVIVTTIANLFVIGYFLSRKNRGKASNLLFISIAVSDTLTGISLLPNSFGVYARYYVLVTKEWCNAYMILRLYVSPVFHTVSIWQTVMLGLQRYVCVCHPFISARVCTSCITICSVIVIYVVAIGLHSYHIGNSKLNFPRCSWNIDQPCTNSCLYLWFSVTLQHLIPVFLLLWLTVKTIVALKKAQRRASTIISSRTTAKRTSKEKMITVTAAWIVVCFLIPELPYGIYKLIYVIQLQFNLVDGLKITAEGNHQAICIYEIALIISFHANFWIYCAMMYDFRHTMLKLLTFGAFKTVASRLRSFSVSSLMKERSGSVTSRARALSRSTSVHSTTSENVYTGLRLATSPTSDKGKPTFPNNDAGNDDDVFM